MGDGLCARHAEQRTGIPALTIIDTYTRESPAIEVDASLSDACVAAVLE